MKSKARYRITGKTNFGRDELHESLAEPKYWLASKANRVSGLVLCLWLLGCAHTFAAAYPDRFVWVFGWGLEKDSDVAEIGQVLDKASQHGLNGAVISFGLDTLCKKDADYFRRLDAVQQRCQKDGLEVIPSVFSIGYAGGLLTHNPNLAEGLPVTNEVFAVSGNTANFVPDSIRVVNGDFEDFSGDKFGGFDFCDDPGKVSFPDTETKHGGRASLRLENFAADPYGHARVMETIHVTPHHCYRVKFWVKTENLKPTRVFNCEVLAHDQNLAPRAFNLQSTSDWRQLSFVFNSLGNNKINLYAGLWGGKSGKLWLDDLSVEDTGPVNVLHRPGTPVTVRSEDGSVTYTEGQDYEPLKSPEFSLYRGDSKPAVLKLTAGSRIKDGDRLHLSWYHSLLLEDSQITACMAEPEVYEIFDHEAKLLEEHLHPHKVLLSMDEIRMGGTCQACAGRNMAELVADCVKKGAAAVHKYSPEAKIYVWSDMFDPTHNAHPNYFLVQGDVSGSWKYLPKDTTIVVWSGPPRPESMKFFADHGFSTVAACYYDEDNLDNVKRWMDVAKPLPNVRGFMYTPWLKRYDLLPDFGDLLKQ